MTKLEMRWGAAVLLGAMAAACGGSAGGDAQDGAGGQGGDSPPSGGASTGGQSATGGKSSSGGSVGAGEGGEGGDSSEKPCYPTGLTAYYKADGDVREEISGEDGELIGSAVADAEGVFGQAWSSFGDVDAARYIEGADIDGDEFGSGDFSIAFWVNTDGGYILDKRVFEEGGSIVGYHVYTYGGAVGLQIADGSYDNYTANPSTAAITDNEWHHVVISVDRDASDGLKFYVDGELADTQDPTTHQASVTSAAPLVVGGHGQLLEHPTFNGSIDELQLYSRALTATDAEYLVDHATLAASCD